MTTSHEDIMLIYKWFCAAMRKAGRSKESFPKGTDPRKTYKYRALSKFATNVEEWGFDNATTKSMVYAVVDYGKQNKLLGKGAMILTMKSVLEICIEDLEQKSDEAESAISAVQRCRTYLIEGKIDSSRRLASPERAGGMPRILALIASGKMPRTYLAVSRMARAALSTVDDRDDYPSNRELRKLRARLLYDSASRVQLEEILGSDLDTSGLVGSVTCRT